MKWRSGKPNTATLVGLAIFSCVVFYIAEKTAHLERQPYFEKKLEATKLALTASEAIKAYRQNNSIGIDLQNDPYNTGLIGLERTQITTDRGVFASKVLSTNPNFAAAFVDMLVKLRLKRRSIVAIGMTGSFPGLNISVLAACKALDLHPIIITSVGASDWGANYPELTWLDMEKILNERGILPFKSIAASIGGGADNGRGLSPEGRDMLRRAIKRNNVTLIDKNSVQENISKRMDVYKNQSRRQYITCYINIGGGTASLGGAQNALLIPSGLIRHLAVKNYPVRGVINLMAEQSIPVINVLKVDKLAVEYGIPVEMYEQAPNIGEGILFFKNRYSVSNTIVLTIILLIVIYVVIKIDIAHYIKNRKTPKPITDV